jgi:hypothetical protein
MIDINGASLGSYAARNNESLFLNEKIKHACSPARALESQGKNGRARSFWQRRPRDFPFNLDWKPLIFY